MAHASDTRLSDVFITEDGRAYHRQAGERIAAFNLEAGTRLASMADALNEH